MRAVIIPPPLIGKGPEYPNRVHPPLGPINLAMVARQAGHDVTICDINVARCRGDLPDSELWYEAAAEYVLASDPEIVGFGTMSSSFPATILIARAIKASNPSLPVVFGGPQATLVCRDILAELPEVDFVLTGEADYSFTKFLDNISTGSSQKVPGLAQRHKGGIALEPQGPPVSLDSLPINDFSLWPLKEAVQRGWFKTGIPIEAGRGCPYRCYFCSTNKFFQHKYRMKSPVRMKEEITLLHEEYGFSNFKLIHDFFTVSRKEVKEISEALNECEVSELTWSCFARADSIDRQMLEIMWNGGCRSLLFGIETGSSRMQKIIGKGMDLGAVESVLLDALELGFRFTISCITGFPEEDWNDVEATLAFLLRWSGIDKVSPVLLHLELEHGTKVFEKYSDRLQCDSGFSELCLSEMYPEREIAIANEHPEFFPQCHFVPNDRIERKEIVQTVEFARLLLRRLPGIGPFVLREEPSILDLIKRWRVRCEEEGLPEPKEIDFFEYASKHHVPYMRVLLEELKENPQVTGTHQDFLTFWESILDFESDPASFEKKKAPDLFGDGWEVGQYNQIIPVITQRHALITLDQDVNKCLEDWNQCGIWMWPESGTVHYLLSERQECTEIRRLPPAAAAVVSLCDGKRTLAEIYTILEAVSVRRENLDHAKGITSIMDNAFRFLGEAAGVSFVQKG